MGALEGSQYYAQGQVVVLNQGGEDGLKQGCMFEVYNTGSHVFASQGQFSYEKKWFDKGMLLPSKKVGELMVIRPYDKFSLALITRSQTAFNQDVMALSPLAANAALSLSSDTDD